MANTLTPIIPSVIRAIRSVARRSGSLLNLCDMDVGADQVGLGQSITLPNNAAIAAYTVTPGPTPPAFVDQVVGSNTLTLDQHKGARFSVTSEDEKKIDAGAGFIPRSIERAVEVLVNGISDYHYGIAAAGAGLAFGTAGTTPFASDPNLINSIWADLMDDQCPNSGADLFGVVDHYAWATAGNLAQFQKMNESPDGVSFATNSIGMLGNFNMQWDQTIANITKGTGASYVTSGANAVGDTAITLATGSGTVLAGDVILVENDTNQYVVATGTAAPGGITIHGGLRIATSGGETVTIQATAKRNLFGNRQAIKMGVRPSASSKLDNATDQTVVSDPVTGLSLRLAAYGGYHGGSYELSAVYGGVVDRPEWLRILLG